MPAMVTVAQDRFAGGRHGVGPGWDLPPVELGRAATPSLLGTPRFLSSCTWPSTPSPACVESVQLAPGTHSVCSPPTDQPVL